MSFGFSPSDILTVIEIATRVYQGWRSACGEYGDVTGNLEALCIVLGRVKEEATGPKSVLVRSAQDYAHLREILNGCLPILRELEKIRGKFSSLGLGKNKATNWDRIRFGIKNLDGLRTKLTQHVGMLTAYMTVAGMGSQSRVEENINTILSQLQKILEELSLSNGAEKREEAAIKHIQVLYRRKTVGDNDSSGDAGNHAQPDRIVPPPTSPGRTPPLPTDSACIAPLPTGSSPTLPSTHSLDHDFYQNQEIQFTQGRDPEFDENKNIPPYMDWKNNFDRSGLLAMGLPYRDLNNRDNGTGSALCLLGDSGSHSRLRLRLRRLRILKPVSAQRRGTAETQVLELGLSFLRYSYRYWNSSSDSMDQALPLRLLRGVQAEVCEEVPASSSRSGSVVRERHCCVLSVTSRPASIPAFNIPEVHGDGSSNWYRDRESAHAVDQSPSGRAEILLVDGREAEAEILPALLASNLRRGAEDRTGRDEDEVGGGGPEDPQCLGQAGLLVGFLVGGVERMRVKVDLQPEEHATDWPFEGVKLGFLHHTPAILVFILNGGGKGWAATGFHGELAVFHDLTHLDHAPFIIAPQAFQPADPAIRFPPLTVGKPAFAAFVLASFGGVGGQARVVRPEHEFGNHRLHEPTRLLCACLCDAQEPFDECGLGGNPSQSAAWRDCLGKRIETDHTSIGTGSEFANMETSGLKDVLVASRAVVVFAAVAAGNCRYQYGSSSTMRTSYFEQIS
nr:hypothetical protein CFP56_30054 [Quercus suber]